MIKRRTTDMTEVGEKRKVDGSSGKNNNKNKKISKSSNKSRSNHEGKCCDQYKKSGYISKTAQ